MKRKIVELKNFGKTFGEKTVIDNINLDVYEGEFLTLLGSSGCGKTTILRSISGLDSPSNGTVIIDGKDVTNLEPMQREVNTLFQNYALFPLMTVEDNIEFGLKMKKVPKEERRKKVKEMLKLVNLEGYENRKPKELSGGEQQRVSIARGLINRPKVLLLDEPLSALDLKLRKKMQVELKLLQKKLGITFIYVTHNQDEALTMSDRIALLHNGKIEQIDTPVNIYEHPKTVYVADFIGESNMFDGEIIDINGNYASVKLDLDETENIKVINNNFNVGDKVKVIVRPENFKILKADEKTNSIEVKIKEYIYDGSITNIIAKGKNNQEIKITVPRNKTIVAKGTITYIHWNINDSIVLGETNV